VTMKPALTHLPLRFTFTTSGTNVGPIRSICHCLNKWLPQPVRLHDTLWYSIFYGAGINDTDQQVQSGFKIPLTLSLTRLDSEIDRVFTVHLRPYLRLSLSLGPHALNPMVNVELFHRTIQTLIASQQNSQGSADPSSSDTKRCRVRISFQCSLV
jgi:hypothetical protein